VGCRDASGQAPGGSGIHSSPFSRRCSSSSSAFLASSGSIPDSLAM